MDLALRKSYRGQLTKLVNSVVDFLNDDTVSVDDVAILFERIKTVNLTLKDLNEKLAPTFQEEQFEEECKKIVDYDDSATKALALLQRRLTSQTQFHSELQRNLDEANSVVPPVNNVNTGNDNHNIMQHTSIRLPKLEIIKFNGEIALWPEFWEQYSFAIHENKTLDNTAKFAYLKSYLTGKAAITISGLSSSQSSYNDAIELLKTEYACPEKIIDTYIQKLLSLCEVKHERDVVALRKLFTTTTTITKSLSTLGISPEQYGLLVKSIVFKALPYNMRIAYTKQKLNANFDDNESVSGASNASSSNSSNSDYGKQIKTLLHFIKVELDSIDQARCNDYNEPKDRDKKHFRFERKKKCSDGRRDEFTASGLFASAKEGCLFCKSKLHVTPNCDSSLNISAKKDILKQNKLCFRCTKSNHNSRFCRSRDIKCTKCSRRHVTTMCEGNIDIVDNANARLKKKSIVDVSPKNSKDGSTSLVAAAGISDNIYLKTACTYILSANVEPLLVRMIIDGGSQLSFIREDVSRSLSLPVDGTHKIAIQCFGQSERAPARVCNRVKIRLRSQYSDNIVELSVIEVPEICFDNIKPPSKSNPVIKEFSLKNCLADFVIGAEQPLTGISLLIGADSYWNIVLHETVRLENNLSAINTQFGWTIHGASDNISSDNYLVNFNSNMMLHVQVQEDFSDNLDFNLKKFWDLETLGISASDSTLMNKFTENFMKNNVTFENERYQVTLPWQTDDKLLDSNFSGTLVRAKGLVNKLCKNGTLKDYDSAVREYVRSGCAEEVPNNEISVERAYYMPHRPVYRNDKETTKLRVVFDASAHARGTPSLNDKLSTGENLLPDLLTILISFRLGAVGLVADIEKAFLQIGLCKKDRDYHRFLWFKNPIDNNITSTSQLPDFTTFRMTRVTFGVTTSPYLLAVVLKKHLTQSSEKDIASILLKSFYVDDLILAVQSTSEALEVYGKAKNILLEANMNLRKWCTNDPTLLPYVNRDVNNSSVKKVLGIIWRPFTDELAVDLGATISSEPNVLFTKRSVLQTIAKIFDPMGLLGPFTVKAKIILQNIWKKKLDWDDVLPEDIDKEWRKWHRGLPLLSDYSIKRCLIENPTDEVELHVFADASPQAYGCVAYLRHLTTRKCEFIVSKNRVSPINENNEKSLTLPKLELTAALCAARLQKYLTENMSLNFKEVILLSDSKIALYWIKGKETKWKPYIQNRVVEICELQSKESWRYCPGKQNPADLLTRGVPLAKYLIDSKVWLTGASWLEQEREHWPIDEFLDKKEIDVLASFVEVEENPTLIINPIFNLDRPCPDSPPEFREEQCAAFNHISYEGSFYQWFPFFDDDEPCALTCKGKPEDAHEDALLVVDKLKDKVHDGTRCRPGSLDMCIDGSCQRVGCDLKIGSKKQVDECGVCGGDGSSCAKPLYHWTLTYASLCSTTCGGGYKMSRPICQNRVTGDEVEEELCNDSQRPDSTVVECNTHSCPPKWHVGDWGLCSRSCGGGSRSRAVHCVEETNSTKIKVDESKCGGHKPWFQEACNQMDCPTWFTTKWSGCSVSCGEGIQTRMAECRDTSDQPNDLCDAKSKPETTQVCSTGITCPFRVDTSEELMPGLYQTQPLEPHFPPPPLPERLVGEQLVPSESTFIPDEWGPCSVSCGEGIRRREVHCKIFLEFSRTIAKLPDKQCAGVKPVDIEKCYREPCSTERIGVDIKDDPSNIKVGSGSPAKSYSWKEQGFTHCSASCLGGVQELIINCVRDDTQKVTSPFMCPIELKPEAIIRACNEHSCPPRWSYTEFSPCSQSCGIGIQTRDVNCIHELTQGGSNTVVVPNNRCPQPPPPDRQYCNVLDCPVRWKVSDWSKCTKPCGGGEKARKVDCKQVMAQNHTVDRPPTMCPTPRPLDKKPCNSKSCIIETDQPHISVTNSTFIQHDPKKNKVTVKVGGAATLFTGTTVKIKCPVKRFDRSKIQWRKDNNVLQQTKKFKSSKKGALRVQNLSLRDMGTYTCVAGKSTANIVISVRPKPGEFLTSEEIQKHYKTDLISGMNAAKTEGKPIYADDQSHEQRPDGKKKVFKLFTPTSSPSSLTLDGYVSHTQTTQESGNKRHQSLWPFQVLKFEPQASRGHRMVTFPVNPEQIPATDQAVPATDSDDDVNEVVLGKGNKENLKLEWILTDWSTCSETCGGNGFQIRTARCTVNFHNTTEAADNHLCEDAGIPIPDTSRKCGFDECPQWTASDWQPCEKSKCFGSHKAMQKRIVKCQIAGNLTVTAYQCDLADKPPQHQECYNVKCVGKWKVGTWSKCNAKCDKIGEKYRTFHCVWYGTKKPAGDACRTVARPPTRKPCKGPPCSDEPCKDLSMFCTNVKSLDMCKIVRYKQQCCQTCKIKD